jgi:uncharacterized membrane protein
MRNTLELLGLAALGFLVWMTWDALQGVNRLPDSVPIHFDASGTPNAWGSPAGMLLLPVLAAALYLVMSIVVRFPDAFHYPVRVTAQNIARLQAVTLNMVAWLKMELICLFAVLQWAFIQAARSSNGHLFPLILPVFIVVIFGTVGWHLLAIVRAAGSSN